MNGRNVAHSSLWVLLISGFFGCAGAGPFVTLPSSAFFETDVKAVSYTHLTLPTSDLV